MAKAIKKQGSKGSKSRTAGITSSTTRAHAKAVSILSNMEIPLLALDDLGRMIVKAESDPITVAELVYGLTRKITGLFTECGNALPKGHPAIRPIICAQDAIDRLNTFMREVDQPDDKATGAHRRMVADVVRMFTGRIGRDMERAEKDCGGSPSSGFLADGFMMERNDMRQIIEGSVEGELLWLFRTIKPKGQAQILAFSQAVKEKESL